MNIKELKISDLSGFINSDSYNKSDTLPITRHRACSHIANPRASANDLSLLVAYEEDKIIGFLGILPDTIFIDNKEHKIGWLSGWWVHPDFVKTSIGALLLLKAISYYKNKVAVLYPSKSAEKVYEALPQFIKLRELQGTAFIIRFNNRQTYYERHPSLSKLEYIIKPFAFMLDLFTDVRFHFWNLKNKSKKNYNIEYINEIDEETSLFIEKYQKKELTKRGINELNWIIKNPWVLNAPLEDNTSVKYHFSSVAKRFLFMGIKIYNCNNEMIGFLIIKVRDNKLNVPYCYFAENSINIILHVIVYHIQKLNIGIFITFNQSLIENIKRLRIPFYFKVKRRASFFISRDFKTLENIDFNLQDGDGELAFT